MPAEALASSQGMPPAEVLTPPAPQMPRINGPKIYGARPGAPFLYRIPCTGNRPMDFAAEGLPRGLGLSRETGIISGVVNEAGTYDVRLVVRNAAGTGSRGLRIVAGGQLALTPPMGWNDWYVHYARITEMDLRRAADQMIASGIADYGYQYVNCDDCWMRHRNDPPYRDPEGNLLPNSRFPDIKGMVDHIHLKGLKAGIYTSPGPWTCGGYAGSYGHEAADAAQFARLGFDFVKYDWCSYGDVADRGGATGSLEALQKPYRLMGRLIRQQRRDIVINLCQYGMGDVWNWGSEFGNCWRTTGDVGLEKASGLPPFYSVGLMNAEHAAHAHPGAWNDPDYILIGVVGDARTEGEGKPTTLTPDEQYSYMSMWCLMAAPLFFSGDMTKIDAFTLNVLCNAEVIAVDQDVLGRQARILRRNARDFVLVKELEGGAKAVGLFNLQEQAAQVSVSWADLSIRGEHVGRDLWRQKDVGEFADHLSVLVPRHGVKLIRLAPAESIGGDGSG